MRIIAILTIDGHKERCIEGDCPYLSGSQGDSLETQGLGIWLHNWQEDQAKGRRHKGRVFVPWTSCLYMIEAGNWERRRRDESI